MCYNPVMEQLIAFDIGRKRVGVAYSDPFGEYAMPGDTYFRCGDFSADAAALAKIARERGASAIVCGLPLNADGSESEQTAYTRRFLEALQGATELPVYTEDERFTTLQARQDLCTMGVSSKKDKKKKSVDSLAAAYILEGYLAKHKKGGEL